MVATKRVMDGWNWNGLFHSVVFRILIPKALLYLSLNPKNLDLGIPTPRNIFVNNWKITERSVPFLSGF